MRTFLRLTALAAVAVLSAASILAPAVAFAQAAIQTIDLHPLVTPITEAIVDVAVSLIGILGLWLSLELKKKWGIDIDASVREIEANHRDALHSAVETAANAAVARFGPLTFDTNNASLQWIIEQVRKSVPDAIAALRPTESWIINKAAAAAGVTPIIPLPDAPAAPAS